MKVAFIGMGKLGFPCALAAASRGHEVVGYDVSPDAYEIFDSRKYPHREVQAQQLLEETTLRMVDTVDDVVEHAEIVFVAVQTPHRPEFEGLNRMPDYRADFDYSWLHGAVAFVAEAARNQRKHVVVAIISTCLPGTCKREIYPLLNEYTAFIYNPFFIAMGTTIADYLKPEFVLIGVDSVKDMEALEKVQQFYRELHCNIIRDSGWTFADLPKHAVMSVTSAELCKVFYNVFLGMKIIAANAGMEIAHKLGANIDDVTNALAFATDRVVSTKYMRGGMGDGGGCHPRDQIALSWLAQEHGLSYDIFEKMIECREAQTAWLAELVYEASNDGKLPIVVLGKAYKKGTNLTLGSPAILLKNILDEYPHLRTYQFDPHADPGIGLVVTFGQPAVFVIATDHDDFFTPTFRSRVSDGSIVIDPWGKYADQDGIKVVRVGRT